MALRILQQRGIIKGLSSKFTLYEKRLGKQFCTIQTEFQSPKKSNVRHLHQSRYNRDSSVHNSDYSDYKGLFRYPNRLSMSTTNRPGVIQSHIPRQPLPRPKPNNWSIHGNSLAVPDFNQTTRVTDSTLRRNRFLENRTNSLVHQRPLRELSVDSQTQVSDSFLPNVTEKRVSIEIVIKKKGNEEMYQSVDYRTSPRDYFT